MFGGMAYKIGVLAKKATGGGGSDVTPNAVNWSDISANNITGQYLLTEKQITGINQTITLRVQYTSGLFQLYYTKNYSGDLEGFSSETIPSELGLSQINHNGTFTVSNNDEVAFGVELVGAGSSGPTTVTVQNADDGYATLDTFNVTITEIL
jgi:hypothetical protein